MPPKEPEYKVDLWMPLDLGKYLKDTMSLDAEEFRAYSLALVNMWINHGYLDDDKNTLKNVTFLGQKTFQKKWSKISKLFEHANGKYFCPELLKHFEKAVKCKTAYVERAKKAAEARWDKHSNKDATGNASSMHLNGKGTGKGKEEIPKKLLEEQLSNLADEEMAKEF